MGEHYSSLKGYFAGKDIDKRWLFNLIQTHTYTNVTNETVLARLETSYVSSASVAACKISVHDPTVVMQTVLWYT